MGFTAAIQFDGYIYIYDAFLLFLDIALNMKQQGEANTVPPQVKELKEK